MSYETTSSKQVTDTRDMREDRAQLIDDADALLSKAKPSAMDITTARRKTDEARAMSLEIDRAEIHNDSLRDEYAGKMGGRTSRTVRFRDEAGKEIRSVGHNESFRTAISVGEPAVGVGALIVARATGDWSHIPEAERRNYQQAASASGGFLLNPEMSASVIDLARANSVISAAGATTVPMASEELKIARVATDPTASWTTENMAITESSGTFDMITLRAHCLAVYCTASLELIRNAANAQALIENSIAKAIALKLDESCLNGQGAAQEPWGLLHSSQVGTRAIGGAISHDGMLNGCRDLWNANIEPASMIYDANMRATIAALKDGEGQYQAPPADIAKLSKYTTTQLSSTDSDNCMYIGDFSNCILGLRSQVEIEVSPHAGDVFQKKQIAIRGMLWGDFFTCRSGDIVRLTGISGTT